MAALLREETSHRFSLAPRTTRPANEIKLQSRPFNGQNKIDIALHRNTRRKGHPDICERHYRPLNNLCYEHVT